MLLYLLLSIQQPRHQFLVLEVQVVALSGVVSHLEDLLDLVLYLVNLVVECFFLWVDVRMAFLECHGFLVQVDHQRAGIECDQDFETVDEEHAHVEDHIGVRVAIYKVVVNLNELQVIRKHCHNCSEECGKLRIHWAQRDEDALSPARNHD